MSLTDTLLTGLALVLIVEGLLPFASPNAFRRYLLTLLQQPENALRMVGFVSIMLGAGLLFLVT